jgi:hypothetical protein
LTTLNSFYASANALSNLDQRRWSLGAAYRLGEYTRFGYSIAAARALVLAAPQYANGLAAAGLTAAYNAVDDVGSVAATTGISLPGTAGNYVSAPSSAALQPAGDLDLRVRATLTDWTPVAPNTLLAKWSDALSGYLLYIDTNGTLNLATSSASGQFANTASSVLGIADGAPKWLRGTRANATGAVTLYTSDDGSAWTQVGTGTSAAGAIDLNAAVPVTVGANSAAGNLLTGTVHRAIVMGGGVTRADFDPSLVTRTATRTPATYTDAQGNVWTPNGTGWDWI